MVGVHDSIPRAYHCAGYNNGNVRRGLTGFQWRLHLPLVHSLAAKLTSMIMNISHEGQSWQREANATRAEAVGGHATCRVTHGNYEN